ncbi:MAG: hypothetical protein QM661_10475 [Solimonas sp.]
MHGADGRYFRKRMDMDFYIPKIYISKRVDDGDRLRWTNRAAASPYEALEA